MNTVNINGGKLFIGSYSLQHGDTFSSLREENLNPFTPLLDHFFDHVSIFAEILLNCCFEHCSGLIILKETI